MATKKTLPLKRKTNSAVPQLPTAYGRLHSLLHTVRRIAQFEDVLCEITNTIKQPGELSPQLIQELDEILDKIPSQAYISDLDAVRTLLIRTPPSTKLSRGDSVKSRLSGRHAGAKKSDKLAE